MASQSHAEMARRIRGAAWLIAAALCALTVVGTAAATSLGDVERGWVAAGSAAVTSCDTSRIKTSYTTVGGMVVEVVLSGVGAAGCDGARVSLCLQNAAGSVLAAPDVVSASAGANSVSIPIDVSVDANAVARLTIAVAGD